MEILVIILILIVASPILLILFAWGAHSYEVEKAEEKRLEGRFQNAVNRLRNGDVTGILSVYNNKFDSLETQVIIKIAQTIINNNPKEIKKIAKEHPDIYSIIEPNLYNTYTNYSKYCFLNKNYLAATIWYKMAYELKQDDKTCSYLGYSYLQLQDYKNALFYLEKSIKNFFVLYNLFIITLYLKQYKEALYYFSELRKNYPSELEKKGKLLTKIPLEHLTEEIL